MNDVIFIAAITLKSSIAVLLASLGEIVTEKSGVLNLGVEGMMLVGAMAGFVAGHYTGSLLVACAAAMLAASILAYIHALITIKLRADQVISGLAITITGIGLSSFLGRPFIGRPGIRLNELHLGVLDHIPFLGPVFSQQTVLALIALGMVPLVWYVLFHTPLGLSIRASGEDPAAADAAGVPVFGLRYICTIFGGMMAGLAGAYLSLSYTPGWKEGMTAGQGWIAIAMVIFSTWNPARALLGALLFGSLNALQFYFQAIGSEVIPTYVLRMLPYVLTVFVLFLVTVIKRKSFGASPAALGRPFSREN
jgi:ABC-type uncharacterized transport system permease subunit